MIINTSCVGLLILLQVVIFSVKLEMGQDEEPVMKTFYATQMEFVSQFVQFKDLKATG